MSMIAKHLGAVIVASCLAAVTPASAQAPVDFELRRLAGMHAAATYARGANTACELFGQGELRALAVLAQATGEALEVDAGPGSRDRINKFFDGRKDWKGCPTRAAAPQAWVHIFNAKILARALIAAPAAMSRDPATCKIAEENRAFERKVWQFAADVQAEHYRASPREAEFAALQGYFAEQVDSECKYAKGGSLIMQAAFDFVRRADETIIAMNDNLPHRPPAALRVGADDAVPIPREQVSWRSRAGDFVPSRIPVNFGVYRIPGNGDPKAISAPVVPADEGGPSGFLFISRAGKWSARLDKDVRALRLHLGSNRFVPIDRSIAETASKAGVTPAAFAFEMSNIGDAMLLGAKVSAVINLQYQDAAGLWISFAPLKRNQAGDPLRKVDIETALGWVNVPAIDVGKE